MHQQRTVRSAAWRRLVVAGFAVVLVAVLLVGSVPVSVVAGDVHARRPECCPTHEAPRTTIDQGASHGGIDQDDGLTVVGQVGGPTHAVAAIGSHLVAGVGPRLHVFAVCDPYAPVFVAQTEILPGVVQDVLIDGRRAYVALEDAGLGVVDLSDLTRPTLSSLVALPGSAGILAAGDGRLYVGAGTGGVRIMDLGDPWAPREIGVYGKIVSDMVVVGQHIYAVQRNLTVVDTSDPTAPREWTKLEDWADAVTTDGRYLYVGASVQGAQGARHGSMHVYDLSVHPRRPPMVGDLPLGGPVRHMVQVSAVEGPEIWLLEPGVFRRVYVRMASAPVVLESMSVPDTALRLAHWNEDFVALATGADGLRIHIVGWGQVSSMEGIGAAGAVASWNGLAFVGSNSTEPRIAVVDVSQPDEPRILARIVADVAHKALAASDGYLYVGASDQTLRTYDVHDPMRPRLTSKQDLPDEAWSLDVTRGRLYVANDDQLRVFDLSSPDAPRETGSLATTGGANDVVGGDGFVFVTGPTTRSQPGKPSLQVIDARVPGRMREIGTMAAAGWRHGLAHADPYVFLGGLQVIDVTDLAGPRELARLDTDADSRDSVLLDGRLYVAQKTRAGGGQLSSYDVSAPEAPRHVRSLDTIDGAVGIASSWGYVHVAAGEAGLVVVTTGSALPAPTPTAWPGPPFTEHVYLPMAVRGPLGSPCP